MRMVCYLPRLSTDVIRLDKTFPAFYGIRPVLYLQEHTSSLEPDESLPRPQILRLQTPVRAPII